MSESLDVRELIRRARTGDPAAEAVLARTYGPHLRRELEIRRLADPAVAPHIDASGLCDSVWGEFFVRLRRGDWQLDDANMVRALLAAMALNRYIDEKRKALAARRDVNRQRDQEALAAVPAGQASPSQNAVVRELYEEVERRLTDEERRLARGQAEGRTWMELAGPERAAQDRLRHRLEAAFGRVADELSRLRPDEPLAIEQIRAAYQLAIRQAVGGEEP
jgi:RNA polymerase sigma-70 factor (ECF subfamily)